MSDQDSHTIPDPIDPRATPKRRASAITRASGHSLLSSFMMILLPLIFLGTIGYFLYAAGVFGGGEERISRPTPVSSPAKGAVSKPRAKVKTAVKKSATRTVAPKGAVSPTKETKTPAKPATQAKPSEETKMVAPKITRFDKKSRTYIVEADTAVRDKNLPDILNLEKVKSEIRLQQGKGKVFIVADHGVFNKKSDELDLRGNIRVRSTNGYRATLSTAYLWLKQGRILSNTPVVVYMPQGTVAANGIEILDGGDTIKFLNRARMDLKGKDK